MRAAMLVALGVALWVVNWLIVRREGPRAARAARYGAAVHLIVPDEQDWMTLPLSLSTVRSLSENVPFAPLAAERAR